MHSPLTDSCKSDLAEGVEAENAPVMPGDPAETTSSGAGQAGPRVERAEARQQRDASTATVTLSVNASEITDPKAFKAFLRRAGFSRTFAKRVTNHDAFESAAEQPSDDTADTRVAEALTSLIGRLKG